MAGEAPLGAGCGEIQDGTARASLTKEAMSLHSHFSWSKKEGQGFSGLRACLLSTLFMRAVNVFLLL